MTSRQPDFEQTARQWARTELQRVLGTIWGIAGIAVTGVVGGVIFPLGPSAWDSTARGALGGATLIIGIGLIGWVVAFVAAWPLQRREARQRLMDIKEASSAFELHPVEATGVPTDSGDLIRVLVENVGSGGRYGVVIEEIEGTDEPLIDPFAPLHWMARPHQLNIEIPTGERRLIGLGFVERSDAGIKLWPRSPSGKRYRRGYELTKGTTTFWLRISTRGLPEITYVRWVSVCITWDGNPASEYSVSLGPDHDPPEQRLRNVALAPLLDY